MMLAVCFCLVKSLHVCLESVQGSWASKAIAASHCDTDANAATVVQRIYGLT